MLIYTRSARFQGFTLDDPRSQLGKQYGWPMSKQDQLDQRKYPDTIMGYTVVTPNLKSIAFLRYLTPNMKYQQLVEHCNNVATS